MDYGEQIEKFSNEIKPTLEERAKLCAKREKLLNAFLALTKESRNPCKPDGSRKLSTVEEGLEEMIQIDEAHKAFMEVEDEFRIFDRDLSRWVSRMNQDQINLMWYMAAELGCEDGLPGKTTDEKEGTVQSKIQYFHQAFRKIQRGAIVAHGVNGGAQDDWYWHEKRKMAFDKLLVEMEEMGQKLEGSLSQVEKIRCAYRIR